MPTKELAIIVLAAGTGSRMKSSLPKILHPLAGRPMIAQVMATGYSLSPDHSLVIVSPVNKERVSDIVSNSTLVVQGEANGTGGAVLCAKEHLSDFTGNVLILFAAFIISCLSSPISGRNTVRSDASSTAPIFSTV